MPIRINLLAEQQAAEEARRRDPVKRALWAGGFVVGLVLLCSGYVQLKLIRLKSELARQEAQWKRNEPTFLQVSNEVREAVSIRNKLDSLQRYATNRFLWANVLDALQHPTTEKVRVVNLKGEIGLAEHKQVLVSTSLFVNLPPKRWWKLGSEAPKTNVLEAARALLNAITNRPDLVSYQPHLVSSLNVTTNPIQIFAKVEVVKPETVTERISVSLRARDYSNSRVTQDEFYKAVTNAPCFRQFLGKTNSSVQPELLKPKEDPSDLINSTDPFIPFTVEFFFPGRIRSDD